MFLRINGHKDLSGGDGVIFSKAWMTRKCWLGHYMGGGGEPFKAELKTGGTKAA